MTATVTPITAVPKKRSNRSITEFACRHLERFAFDDIQDDYRQVREKNTVVRFVNDGALQVVTVFLFEEEILRLTLNEDRALALTISFTSFLDSYGQPTTTTSERLNGLLDCLGHLGFLPYGVRLFRGEHNTTYLGRGDEKVAVGRDLYRTVYIRPNRERLIFAGFSAVTAPGNTNDCQ
jgi:hypothetical protein